MEQLLAHLVGDYLLQNGWMVTEKTKKWLPAIIHGLLYTLPFLFITTDPAALAIIAGTHIVIDHYRLGWLVMELKEMIAPKDRRKKPDYKSTENFWLKVISDNTIHMLINYAAINSFG